MKRKDKHFTNSGEWLEWLSDEKTEAHQPDTQNAVVYPKASAASPQPFSRQSLSRQNRFSDGNTAPPKRRSLGLDARSFSAPVVRESNIRRDNHSVSSPIITTRPEKISRTITVQFQIPRLRYPNIATLKVLFSRFSVSKKHIITTTVGATILVLFLVIPPFFIKKTGQNVQKDLQTSSDNKPAYAPLVPSVQDGSSSSSTTGDIVKETAHYDATKQLYQFKDTYKGIALVVSEQPLPDGVKSNPDRLKNIADSIGASESVDTIDGKLYASPSEKATSQRVVYASKQLLIFITASGVLKHADWVAYVQSLSSN